MRTVIYTLSWLPSVTLLGIARTALPALEIPVLATAPRPAPLVNPRPHRVP